MSHRLLGLLLLSVTALWAATDAAKPGAWIEGRWMVVSVASAPGAAGGGAKDNMTMRPKPGAMTIEFSATTMTSSFRKPPKGEVVKRASPYRIEQATADSLTMHVTGPGADAKATVVAVKRDGANLVLTDERSITTLQPYDEAAVAKQAALEQAAARPAAAVKDQPLTGRLGGNDWTPILCRRAHFQLDETGKRIRVEALAEKLEGFEPGTKPKLLLSLPTTVGEYPLSGTFNVTAFIPPSQNDVLVDGILRVTAVDDAAIHFSISAHDDEGNEINGVMVADISPLPAP
ncbi:MAG: hypothetical protein H0W72_02420 [Planctomycetes bacterium]|nr:hypothetical protein [Planctomycetota bacterium]